MHVKILTMLIRKNRVLNFVSSMILPDFYFTAFAKLEVTRMSIFVIKTRKLYYPKRFDFGKLYWDQGNRDGSFLCLSKFLGITMEGVTWSGRTNTWNTILRFLSYYICKIVLSFNNIFILILIQKIKLLTLRKIITTEKTTT